jgi:hypothetical protein
MAVDCRRGNQATSRRWGNGVERQDNRTERHVEGIRVTYDVTWDALASAGTRTSLGMVPHCADRMSRRRARIAVGSGLKTPS